MLALIIFYRIYYLFYLILCQFFFKINVKQCKKFVRMMFQAFLSNMEKKLLISLTLQVFQIINLRLQFVLFMQIKVEELLEFCAYYQLNKHASNLTIETIFIDNNKPSPIKQKPEKVVKRKIEVVEPKKTEKVEKVVKRKMQIVPKKEKQQVVTVQKTNKDNRNQDLNYYLSHLSGHSHKNPHKNYEQMVGYNRNYDAYSRPGQYTIKNYDTFGQSNQKYQYQTFQSKMQKQNTQYFRGNLTQRTAQYKPYSTKMQQYSQVKPLSSPYQNYQTTKIKKFWENTVYDTRKNDKIDLGNLMYSPVKRQSMSPSQSMIFSDINDRSVSKSRSKSKVKRKNSERPFYNASQLAPKERQNETRVRKNQYDQSVLSHSFISTEQVRATNNKKALDDEGKRETSTTIYAAKATKINGKRQSFENDLDDNMQEVMHHLASQQRSAPIAISLISKQPRY